MSRVTAARVASSRQFGGRLIGREPADPPCIRRVTHRASVKTIDLVNSVVCKLRAMVLRKEGFAHADANVFAVSTTVRRGVQDGSP